jgi:hypothetical protein
MGKTAKRNLRCKICKASFPSYQEKSKAGDNKSHANHRSRNKRCREIQKRLRKQHLENGNHYDLDFDNGEEMGFEVVEEVDDIDMDSWRGRASTVGSVHFVEEDVEEENAEDDGSVHGSEDLENSYEEEKRLEDLEYQQRENEENYEKENDEEEEGEDDHILDFHVAEAKRDPRNASYWSNPEVDLIGVFVKKSFGTHGNFKRRNQVFQKAIF